MILSVSRKRAIFAAGVAGAAVALLARSGAAMSALSSPPSEIPSPTFPSAETAEALMLRLAPPLGGIQCVGACDQYRYVTLLGGSASFRVRDVQEFELGAQFGAGPCVSGPRFTARAGVAPRVSGAAGSGLRVPVLAGASYTIVSGRCEDHPTGWDVAATLGVGLEATFGMFDVRVLPVAGWQWMSREDFAGVTTSPNGFTYGASLEFGAVFELGPRTATAK